MGIVEKLKRRIHNVTEAISSAVVDSEVQKTRIDICNDCEFLSVVRNCKKCGCFVDAKTKLAIASCPLKKW